MALQAIAKHLPVEPGSEQDGQQNINAVAVPEWVEEAQPYLSRLQTLLAGLTEEDKDAVHASLEE